MVDQDEAYRRIWQAFRTFKRAADGRHDTDDWRSHEGVYAVCGIRVPASSLQPALNELRASLATFPFVRVHPDSFLHITLQELGFVCDRPDRIDEIDPGRLDEFVAAAGGALSGYRTFDLSLGGANSFQDAAFLDVHDRGHCARLHNRLFELAAVPAISKFAYLPHATVAHYTADAPAGNLAAAIAPWRDRRFGTYKVNQVEIVTLRVDEPYPSLEPYAIIPLGQ
jgi:2'-5' RNA ligase